RFCEKYFNKADVDVSLPPQQFRFKDEPKKEVAEEKQSISPTVQGKVEYIDVALNTLRNRLADVIETVVHESNHAQELADLKQKVKELEAKVAEYEKYKQAAKDSSVWGVLKKRFGHVQ